MDDVIIKVENADAVAVYLRNCGRATTQAASRAMKRISNVVLKKAVEYAPRSATRTIISKTLKVQRRSKSQRTPGGLEKSIKSTVRRVGTDVDAIVFVASNAPAGKYAARIHNQKGKTWFKRGPGTVAKGPQADEKFIARAIKDTERYFMPILEQETQRGLKT